MCDQYHIIVYVLCWLCGLLQYGAMIVCLPSCMRVCFGVCGGGGGKRERERGCGGTERGGGRERDRHSMIEKRH